MGANSGHFADNRTSSLSSDRDIFIYFLTKSIPMTLGTSVVLTSVPKSIPFLNNCRVYKYESPAVKKNGSNTDPSHTPLKGKVFRCQLA